MPSLIETVWIRRFKNFVNLFKLFRYYVSLESGVTLHLKKLEFPSPKDDMCQFLIEIGPVKSEKFTDGQTDDGQQAIRKAFELSAQVSLKKTIRLLITSEAY